MSNFLAFLTVFVSLFFISIQEKDYVEAYCMGNPGLIYGRNRLVSFSSVEKYAGRSFSTFRNRFHYLSRLQSASNDWELLPEVLEGIEIHRISVENEDEKISKYRIKGSIDGGDLRRLYGVCLNGEKKDARYPGFRRGVLPPSVMYDVKRRTLNAALKDAMVSSMDALGLKMFKEEERSIKMIEPKSIDIMVQEHELSGKDLEFTAELDAIGDVKVDISQVKEQAFTPENDAKIEEEKAKREARKQADKEAKRKSKGESISGFGN